MTADITNLDLTMDLFAGNMPQQYRPSRHSVLAPATDLCIVTPRPISVNPLPFLLTNELQQTSSVSLVITIRTSLNLA